MKIEITNGSHVSFSLIFNDNNIHNFTLNENLDDNMQDLKFIYHSYHSSELKKDNRYFSHLIMSKIVKKLLYYY